MNRSLFLIATCFLSAVCCLHAQLVFEQETLSFTSSLGDTELTARFKFKNTGEETITINKVESSCGCTTTELEKRAYAPGEAGEIKAVFTFGERSGKQVKHIKVNTDERGNRLHQLSLEVDILKEVGLEPKLLSWSKSGEPESQRLIIRLHDPDTMTYQGFNPTLENFTITETESDKPGEIWLDIEPKELETKKKVNKLNIHVQLEDGTRVGETAFLLIR